MTPFTQYSLATLQMSNKLAVLALALGVALFSSQGTRHTVQHAQFSRCVPLARRRVGHRR
jgi:hypothetical protein